MHVILYEGLCNVFNFVASKDCIMVAMIRVGLTSTRTYSIACARSRPKINRQTDQRSTDRLSSDGIISAHRGPSSGRMDGRTQFHSLSALISKVWLAAYCGVNSSPMNIIMSLNYLRWTKAGPKYSHIEYIWQHRLRNYD